MAYLATNDIHVFPTTRRGSGRRFTEQNLTQLNISSAAKKSFVVNPASIGNKFSFVINGYQFTTNSISTISDNFPSDLNIYAKITLTGTSPYVEPNNDPYNELDGQDIVSLYQGVEFLSTGGFDTSTVFYLHILTRKSTTDAWEIPNDSLLDDGIIDGGLIS